MKRFLLTPAAAVDLQDISNYISQRNPKAASKVLTELRKAMMQLARMPGMGHLREDLANEPSRF